MTSFTKLTKAFLQQIIDDNNLPMPRGKLTNPERRDIIKKNLSKEEIRREVAKLKPSKQKTQKSSKKLEKSVENIFSVNFSLFMAVKLVKNPNYSKILTFINSFGLSITDLTPYLIKKINDGDLTYSKIKHPDLEQFLKYFLANGMTQLPITQKIAQFHNSMDSYRHLSIFEFVLLLKDLEKQFPYLFSLNSSIHGAPADLLTINQIFPETVIFQRNNRWRV